MSTLRKYAALAGVTSLVLGASIAAAATASASTVTCGSCIHVQNVYAFRGALDAEHAGTAINTPIVLWRETSTTTDSGADLLVTSAGSVTDSTTIANFGLVNQSSLNWVNYEGDTVVRFKYDPFGNGGANTYVGLNGTNVALRADNPNSKWQEFIEVPVTSTGVPSGSTSSGGLGGVSNACNSNCVLIDVGQTQNPDDPIVVADPSDAITGSLVQQDVEFANPNQAGDYPTNEVWDFQN